MLLFSYLPLWMRSTHFLFPNNIFQLSNIETLEKKKREEKESSNYVRNDFAKFNKNRSRRDRGVFRIRR